MVRTKNTFTFGAADTTFTQDCSETGFAKVVIVDVANMTNAVTATVSIKDPDGYELYNSGALAENAVHKQGAAVGAAETGLIPMNLHCTMTVVLSGVPGGTGGAVKVMTYLEPAKRGC